MNTKVGFEQLNSSLSSLNESLRLVQNLSLTENLIKIYVRPAKERNLYDEFFEN